MWYMRMRGRSQETGERHQAYREEKYPANPSPIVNSSQNTNFSAFVFDSWFNQPVRSELAGIPSTREQERQLVPTFSLFVFPSPHEE